jgi:16S rRNA (guanine527-N7)-methyltransferase
MGSEEPTPPRPAAATTPPAGQLAGVLRRYELDLDPPRVERIEKYALCLWDLNRSLNLTRHTDYDKFVTRDVVDSLHLADQLEQGERVLDVGSGGGVPGVLLAILRPDLRLELSESVGKRARALQQILGHIDLALTVHHKRAEEVIAAGRFDTVVARAVAPLAKMLTWFAPCWPRMGRLLVVKGLRWVQERGEARHRGLLKPLELRRAATYLTPGTDAENVILSIRPKRP